MKIYIKKNEKEYITAIESDQTLSDFTEWIQIDEGEFESIQTDYFPKMLADENGCYNFKMENGEVVERTEEEKEIDLVERKASEQIYIDPTEQLRADVDYLLIMEEYR